MGLWENTAFLASPDYVRVADEIASICVSEGRTPVTPAPRVRAQHDDMQYSEDPARWGFAIFPGAPGWTVVKSASLEILLRGDEPRIVKLAQALGCPAFQLNAYDGDSLLLCECDPSGRIDVSGYCSLEPQRHRQEQPQSEDEATARFRNPAVRAAVAEACRRDAGFVLETLVERRGGRGLPGFDEMAVAERRWLEQAGSEIIPREKAAVPAIEGLSHWRVPASAVVARWLGDRLVRLAVDAECAAFRKVFAGSNEHFADNEISVSELIEHRPLPVQPSRALYFDRQDSR